MGVITAYDIFGFSPQMLQGADLLAQALGAVVVVPDFLEGKYAKPQYFGKMTPEEEKEKDTLFAFAFNFAEHTKSLVGSVGAAKEKFAKVEGWAALGLCWGGKVCFSISIHKIMR